MKKRESVRAATILSVILCCVPMFSLAAGEKRPAKAQNTGTQNPFDISLTSGNGPVHIRSGKLEFFYNEKRIVFRSNVVAKRENGTITSDLLTVTYEELGADNSAASGANGTSTARRQRIKEAIAEGNVEITSENRRATCKKAVFDEIKRTVILSGDAVLRDGENEVKGQTVTVDLDEGKTTVEGNPEVRFTPKQEAKQNQEGPSQ
ncbi:MAG: LptA/OstA family protein [Candidatus Binatia bacterium]